MKWNKARLRRKRAATLCAALFFVPSIFSLSASADTKSILNKFSLETNSIVNNIARQAAWSAAKGLHWLVGGLEDVVYNVNSTLGGFFTSDGVKTLENKMIPITVALIGVLILFIGFMTMIKPQQATTIISNLVIGVAVAIALPTLLSAAYNFTNQAIQYINSDTSGTFQKISDKILLDNVTDVTLYDQGGFKSTNLKYNSYFAKPGADSNKITNINPAELVNPDDMKYPDVWKNRVVIDRNGKQVLQELNSGKMGFVDIPIMSEYYYRWKFDWLNIFSTLIVTGLTLIMSGIKIARLLYELAIHQTMTQVMALLDIMTAQRLKKCIQMLLATFGTFFAVFFMLQMYILGMSYITKVSNIILRLILMVALAWAVIDGPNLFEQIFGVDAGIHSALRTVYGLKAAGGIMAGGVAALGGRGALEALKANGIIGTTKAAFGHATGLAGGIGGAAAGLASGKIETAQRLNAIHPSFAAAASSLGSTIKGSSSDNSVQEPSAISSHNASQQDTGSKALNDATNLGATNSAPAPTTSGSPKKRIIDGTGAQGALGSQGTRSQEHRTYDNSPQDSTQQKRIAANEPQTVGGHIRSAATAKIQSSRMATSARRAYSLTKGSVEARTNKRIAAAAVSPSPISPGGVESQPSPVVHQKPPVATATVNSSYKQKVNEIEEPSLQGNLTFAEREYKAEKESAQSGRLLHQESGDKK